MIKINTGIFQKIFTVIIIMFGFFLIFSCYIGFFTNKYPHDNPYLIFPMIIGWFYSIYLLLKISIQVSIADSTIEFKNIITKKVSIYKLSDVKNIEIIDTINSAYLVISFSNKSFKIWINYLQFEGILPSIDLLKIYLKDLIWKKRIRLSLTF